MRGALLNTLLTDDAEPATAPHRISDEPTKDVLDLAFTPGDLPTLPSESLLPSEALVPSNGYGLWPSEALTPSETLTPSNMRGTVAPDVVAVRINVGGIDPYTGTLVGRYGLVCSERLACSESLPCSDWQVPAGTTLSEDVTFAELAGTVDGEHQASIWTNFDGEGWF